MVVVSGTAEFLLTSRMHVSRGSVRIQVFGCEKNMKTISAVETEIFC